MSIYFTSDTHFGHAAIVRHSHRPFVSLEDHDNTLIRNWNSVVRKGDTVYHCGDFAWHYVHEYRSRLNGQIHLIRGNHDRLKSEQEKLFASISDLKKVRVGDQKIYLCHYAMRVWNCSHHGSWHLYGHSHGSLADDPHSLSFDAGVDCHNYFPISFDRVAEIISSKTYRPVDHHKPSDLPDVIPAQ